MRLESRQQTVDQQQIIQRIRNAGVIGAGGAGFPTYFKLNTKCQIVIANGAECEPLLQVDQQVMDRYAHQVVEGITIAMQATGATQAIIGVKRKYTQAIAALENVLHGLDAFIIIHPLDDLYPAGDEQLLVYDTTGRIVPEAGLPLDVGCVVNNVNTLRSVCLAVKENKPVTHRYVTVVGEVYEPKTINLPIGCPVDYAIQLCGGAKAESYMVIDGGPMMGVISNGHIRKTTTGLLVLPHNHPLIEDIERDEIEQLLRSKSICDQCFACTEVCPRYLLGHRLEAHIVMRDIANGRTLQSDRHFLEMSYLCCHCDLCRVWGCPVNLAPGRVMARVKEWLQAKGIKNPYTDRPIAVRDFRPGRNPPVEALLGRLKLEQYNAPAPLIEEEHQAGRVRIELNQHIGAPCRPLVKQGDSVISGQIIADVTPEELGCPLHASITGRVTAVTEQYIDISGR